MLRTRTQAIGRLGRLFFAIHPPHVAPFRRAALLDYTIVGKYNSKKLTGYIATTAPSGADPSTKSPSPAPGTPDSLTTVVKPSSDCSISFSSACLQESV